MVLAQLKGEPKVADEISAMGLFGHNIFDDCPKLLDVAALIQDYKAPMNIWYILKMFSFPDSKFDEVEKILKKMKIQHSTEQLSKLKTSSDVLDLFVRSECDFESLMNNHMDASQYSQMYQVFPFSFLAGKSKKLTMEHKNDFATILGEAKNFESATIPAMIKLVSDAIRNDGKSDEFSSTPSEHCVIWMEEHCSVGFKAFNEFIDRHGHRGINEMEMSSIPWRETPEKIIDMIKSNLKHQIQSQSQKITTTSTIDEILAKIKTPMKFTTRLVFRFLLPRCIRGVEIREKAKSYFVAGNNEARRTVRYLAKLMVNEGLLPDEQLVFHLTVNELRELMKHRDGRLVAKAIRRKKLLPKWNEFKFPEITFGVPKPITSDFVKSSQNDYVLVRGTPVCSGIVTARACVCKSFNDVHKIQKGDILVTYGTDIGWSPYFPILGGVITEIGGLISHGAVVAREYGLPCIVAATNATEMIEDGQTITLNSEQGIVTN